MAARASIPHELSCPGLFRASTSSCIAGLTGQLNPGPSSVAVATDFAFAGMTIEIRGLPGQAAMTSKGIDAVTIASETSPKLVEPHSRSHSTSRLGGGGGQQLARPLPRGRRRQGQPGRQNRRRRARARAACGAWACLDRHLCRGAQPGRELCAPHVGRRPLRRDGGSARADRRRRICLAARRRRADEPGRDRAHA